MDLKPWSGEDVVEYWLFNASPNGEQLPNVDELLSHALAMCGNHIWFDEAFCLQEKVVPARHYYGKTQFGECQDDEELIIYILKQLSVKYPQLLIKIVDQDGDVLPILACDVVPRWLTPERSKNRIFLKQGQLCILPRKKSVPQDCVDWPVEIDTVATAVCLVQKYPSLCQPCQEVNAVLDQHFAKYPEKIDQNLHYCRCALPPPVSHLLSAHPQLLASAVRAFRCRDAISMSSLKERFKYGPEELVIARVRFTKLLYAILSLDRFNPARGSVWKLPEQGSALFKAYNLGLRLTCGFELLLQEAERPNMSSQSRSAVGTDRWRQFLNSLRANDYFRGEMVGSVKYEELLLQAKHYFETNVLANGQQTSEAEKVATLLSQLEEKTIGGRMDEVDLPDDDDSWLIVTEKDLSTFVGHEATRSNQSNNMTQKMSHFLEQSSSYKGVASKEGRKVAPGIDFTGDQFKQSLRRVLSLESVDSSSSSCSMSDYGDESDDEEDVNADELEEMAKWGSEMKRYMAQMDDELAPTKVGQSFIRSREPNGSSSTVDDIDLEDDNFKPVNVDKTLVTNMLKSYWSQGGHTGPSASLLHSLQLDPGQRPVEAVDSDDENIEQNILNGMR